MSIDLSKKSEGIKNFTVKLLTKEKEYTIDTSDVVDFFFVEEIFQAVLVGKLTFFDRTGSLEGASITGHERIAIIYGEEKKIQLQFIIYNIKDISEMVQTGASAMSYVELLLMDPKVISLIHRKFSKSWINTPVSEIIKDIGTNMIGIGDKEWATLPEKTLGVLDTFYMPYWSPVDAISYLIEHGRSDVTKQPGMLFYQNNKGFNFISIEKLLQSREVEKDSSGEVLKYSFDSADGNYVNKILGWSITGIDYDSLIGLSGGHRLGFDFNTKRLLDYSYEYKDVIKNYTMSGEKTLFQDISDKTFRFDLDMDDDIDHLTNQSHHEFIKRYIKQFVVKISVRGHDRRYAGMIADILWKSANKENITHKAYSGKYLVNTIVHQFNGRIQPTYRQMMTLTKTAYTESDSKILVRVGKSKVDKKINDKPIGSKV